VTCDQLVDHATQPARVDRCGIKLPARVRTEQQANQHGREIGVFGVTALTVGKAVQQRGELGDDLGVERGEAFAELWPAERGDLDLREEHAAVAVGGELDEEEVEAAGERPLGIEDGELGPERRAQVLDDLLDGRDQQVFLRDEVVVHEARRQVRLDGDALYRGFGDAVLQDRGAQAVDDLAAPRPGEAGSSHR